MLIVLRKVLVDFLVVVGRTSARILMSMVGSTSSDELAELVVAYLSISILIVFLYQVLQSTVAKSRSVSCEDIFQLMD